MDSAKEISGTSEANKGNNENSSPQASATSGNNMGSNSFNKLTPPTKVLDSYLFAHSGDNEDSPSNVPKSSGDPKELQLQKEREERARMFREQQEGERVKRLKDLEQSFVLAKRFREQQEEERRRKIEEARVKESERRQQVEERKRQIWEAEQERKEAILRRNMEREARIEARRNAQRNSQCFAFGSSTPRTFDLDLAAIGLGRNVSQGSLLMSSVSGRRSEERDLGPPRATSACSLDRKCEENYSPDSNYLSHESQYEYRSSSLEPCHDRVSLSKQISMQQKSSNDMRACLSMWDYGSSNQSACLFSSPSPIGWLVGSGVTVGEDYMSRSMVSLSTSFRGRRRMDITPTPPSRDRSATPHGGMSTPRGKDTSRSPSRPQSSMSGASEISATSSSISAVNMRHRPAPRRPRPYSIAGCAVDTPALTPNSSKEASERQPRLAERIASKPSRPKSSAREKEALSAKPATVGKKPVPPPKSSEVLARAKIHNVPTKDNLRKVPKTDVVEKINVNSSDKEASNGKVNSAEKPPSIPSTDIDQKPQIDNNKKSLSAVLKPDVLENNRKNILPYESKFSAAGADIDTTTNAQINPVLDIHPQNDSKASTENKSADSKPSIIEVESKSADSKPMTEAVLVKSEPENASVVANASTTVVKTDTAEIVNVETTLSDPPASSDMKIEQNDMVMSQNEVLNGDASAKEVALSKPRITSEEEAKAALAEKRRLAREQAEREAELERQRQEELRLAEEEQRRQEEAEQELMEAEQLRLAELHRRLEEEKLQKAIEEQAQREREEKERREEENRQKAEREEQERKAREEAEKQRVELEDRLRKEEEERAERKKRVEQIMARTRNKSQLPPNNAQDTTASLKVSPATEEAVIKTKTENSAIESSASITINNTPDVASQKGPLPDLLNSECLLGSFHMENGHREANGEHGFVGNSVFYDFPVTSQNGGTNHMSPGSQTNGYSSHEDMSCTTSPESVFDSSVLIDMGGNDLLSGKAPSQSAEFLVDFGETTSTTTNFSNENYLINVDNINSNIKSSTSPFIEFDDSVQKKQETAVADLLS